MSFNTMDNKSYNSETNSSQKITSDDEYMKSSDIKLEPKDYDNFSNQLHKDKKQDFKMVEFVELNCIKVEKTEEDAAGDLMPKNDRTIPEIEEKIVKSDIKDSQDDKNLHKEGSNVDKLKYVDILHIKENKTDGFETLWIVDNVCNTNQNEG